MDGDQRRRLARPAPSGWPPGGRSGFSANALGVCSGNRQIPSVGRRGWGTCGHEGPPEAEKPDPLRLIGRLGLGTGPRWGELVRIAAQNVLDGCLVISQTKSGRVRRIPLSSDLLAKVRGRVGKLVAYSLRCSGAFARMVQKLAKVRRFHAQRMRHAFACRWLERGGSLEALQEVLGHGSVSTTPGDGRLSDGFVRAEVPKLRGLAGETVAEALAASAAALASKTATR